MKTTMVLEVEGLPEYRYFLVSNLATSFQKRGMLFSAYADAEFDVGEMLLLSPAVRYENYSDFGNTFNGKLSARAGLLRFICP